MMSPGMIAAVVLSAHPALPPSTYVLHCESTTVSGFSATDEVAKPLPQRRWVLEIMPRTTCAGAPTEYEGTDSRHAVRNVCLSIARQGRSAPQGVWCSEAVSRIGGVGDLSLGCNLFGGRMTVFLPAANGAEGGGAYAMAMLEGVPQAGVEGTFIEKRRCRLAR